MTPEQRANWEKNFSNGDRGANDLDWCAATATGAFAGMTQHQERRDALEHSPAYPNPK